MTDPIHDDNKEPPLDPAMERVQARLRRLMLIAGLTLGVGIFAVFGAILYRIATLDASDTAPVFVVGDSVPAIQRSAIGLPLDAVLIATAAAGRELVLTYRHEGGETLVFVDADALTVTRRLDVAAR